MESLLKPIGVPLVVGLIVWGLIELAIAGHFLAVTDECTEQQLQVIRAYENRQERPKTPACDRAQFFGGVVKSLAR